MLVISHKIFTLNYSNQRLCSVDLRNYRSPAGLLVVVGSYMLVDVECNIWILSDITGKQGENIDHSLEQGLCLNKRFLC